MTLNLASQASNMREKGQLIVYLRQARNQLQTLVTELPGSQNNKITDDTTSQSDAKSSLKTAKNQNYLETMDAPKDLTEVINWLDKLIANAPTPTPLLTTQILDKPKR